MYKCLPNLKLLQNQTMDNLFKSKMYIYRGVAVRLICLKIIINKKNLISRCFEFWTNEN